MRDLIDRALNLAQVRGAAYADVRIVGRESQAIGVKNGIVESVSDDETHGFGVRVIADSAWGFSSSDRLGAEEVDRVTAEAVAIARASALVHGRAAELGPPEVHVGTYKTPVYPVVLAPDAVGDILDYLGYVSFNGLAVLEGRSFLSTRMGQQVMACLLYTSP